MFSDRHLKSTSFVLLIQVPDYFDFVSEPMDFQTIKDKLETLEYSDGKPFVRDMHLVFENCDKYNHVSVSILSIPVACKPWGPHVIPLSIISLLPT